jgi:hypothetical protein
MKETSKQRDRKVGRYVNASVGVFSAAEPVIERTGAGQPATPLMKAGPGGAVKGPQFLPLVRVKT